MKSIQAGVFSTLLAPITAATTERTANLDCQGADYATITIDVGAELNTNATNVVVALLESDDTTASNFATFNSAFNQTIDNTAAAGVVYHVNVARGRKRYLRVKVTPDTTTNGPVISLVKAILDKENRGLNTANAATNASATTVVVG